MNHDFIMLFREKDSKNKKSIGKLAKRSPPRPLNSNKLYTSCMPDIKHPKCNHPKCGAKMQRVYKRDGSGFIQCGWICTECGLFKKDD
jgi:hypothetical protein